MRARPYGRVIAVNKVARQLEGNLYRVATLHPENAAALRVDGTRLVSTREERGVDEVWKDKDFQYGSSGLYAVGLAFFMGAQSVKLAGVPMDLSPHFYGDEGSWRADAMGHRKAWVKARDLLYGRVRSMSGWTRDFLNGEVYE
jgi:hypothetical protein